MGKIALATNIAYHAAKNIFEKNEKSSVAFFSLEMSSEQLSTRILSEQSRIQSKDIRRGRASRSNLTDLLKPPEIYMIYLYIDETPLSQYQL